MIDFNPLELARQYAEALQRYFGERLVSVVLYGSVARGNHTTNSDIDLLIIAESLPESRRERNRILVEIEEKEFSSTLAALHRHSTRIKTPEEALIFSPLYLDLTEDSVILNDKGGFFEGVLERLRRRLKELGARRIWRGKVWYWELKPDLKWGETLEL
ncbi:MAG: nucleotidyltransferase domain-containing protein [Anaerolineae bacterium]|nr:nucleotidyltransferase domain-containing protein [Anaerolineae bacterium]